MISKFSIRLFAFITALSSCTFALAQDPAGPTELKTTMATSSVADSEGPKLKISIDSFLLGRDIRDDYFRTMSSLLDINPKFNLKYNSWLSFNLEADGVFVAGNTKSFYTNEGASINAIFLDEAAANFNPVDGLELRAGALYIAINPIQSIMSQNGFLGASGKYELKFNSDSNISLLGVASVPSSGTITRGLIDDAPNAYFLTETLQAETKINSLATTLKIATSHFEFGNLSSNVAGDSVLIGNSPQSFEGIGTNTRYIIGFEGFETAATIQTDWMKRFSTELIGSAIQNNGAPSDRNSGIEALAKATIKFERFNLIPSYLIFNMGADVTPATYTILPYRYQNRNGFTAGLTLELKKEKVSFFGNYTKGDVIEASPYMSNRESYVVGLEAKYDLL